MAGLFTPTSKATAAANLKMLQANPPTLPAYRSGSKGTTRSRPTSSYSSSFGGSDLSLKRVIGCSTTVFDCHPASRSFAYTAGAAAVVATLNDDLEIKQRFFRARPNAPSLQAAASSSFYLPSTPQSVAQETRNRAAASLREAGIGYSPSSDDAKQGSAKERIKAATCLSFSPDGKWLAVGETGYNPRILIFSMSKDVPSDTPVATMSEHTFGVRDVAFSPCSKYLASIGTANDGYIYVWSLSQTNRAGLVRLHSSNRCTSSVRQMVWMGRSVITVGTRHVKIWKTEDDVCDGRKPKLKWKLTRKQPSSNANGTRVLQGRNAILGSLSDSVLTCAIAVSEEKALICSERGDVCVVDEEALQLRKVATVDFGITCIAVDPDCKFIWVGGAHGNIRPFAIEDIINSPLPISPSSTRSVSPGSPVLHPVRDASVLAMASMLGHVLCLDSNRSLKIMKTSMVDGFPIPDSLHRELPAHKDACLGVRLMPPNNCLGAVFFTWSSSGGVLLWDTEGDCKEEFQVDLEQLAEGEDSSNELRVVRVSREGDFFVTGDKFGVLRILNGVTKECHYDAKAHGSEIMDIAVHEDTVVSCARDRTVQVFNRSSDGWSLSQTLDDHTASVTRVLLLDEGSRLLSCSADRSITLRELCRRELRDGTVACAFVQIRTFNLKSSPVHMTAMPGNTNQLLVSTMDRQVLKLDLDTGKTIHSFKPSDETGDAVIMDSITVTKDTARMKILAGTSSTDKSIRLYDLGGGLIDKEWGHTEGVSDVILLESDSGEGTSVISTGTDGTIMIWELKRRNGLDQNEDNGELDLPKELTASRTPLRRVISRGELMSFSSKHSPTSETAPGGRPGSGTSPPRLLRKKTSGYGMNRIVSGGRVGDLAAASRIEESSPDRRPRSRKNPRDQTPSPTDPSSVSFPPMRRTSHETRPRGKSDASINGAGSVNGLAESLTRSLRSFRKKIDSGATEGGLKPEVLRDLQRELAASAKQLGVAIAARSAPGSPTSATTRRETDTMAQLLGQYSERLMSIVSDRLGETMKKETQDVNQHLS